MSRDKQEGKDTFDQKVHQGKTPLLFHLITRASLSTCFFSKQNESLNFHVKTAQLFCSRIGSTDENNIQEDDNSETRMRPTQPNQHNLKQ